MKHTLPFAANKMYHRQCHKICTQNQARKSIEYDAQGDVLSTNMQQFSKNAWGIVTDGVDTYGENCTYSRDSISEETSGATYMVQPDGETPYYGLLIYPGTEYEGFAARWLDVDDDEVLLDCSMQDAAGAILVGPEEGVHLTVYMTFVPDDTPEIQEFDIRPGTMVYLATEADCKLYADGYGILKSG